MLAPFKVFFCENTKRLDLTHVTDLILKKHNINIEEVNNGYCGYWALLAHKLYPNSTLYHFYNRWEQDEYIEAGAEGHVFIKIGDLYYDALHPTGTDINKIWPRGEGTTPVEVSPTEIDELWGMSI